MDANFVLLFALEGQLRCQHHYLQPKLIWKITRAAIFSFEFISLKCDHHQTGPVIFLNVEFVSWREKQQNWFLVKILLRVYREALSLSGGQFIFSHNLCMSQCTLTLSLCALSVFASLFLTLSLSPYLTLCLCLSLSHSLFLDLKYAHFHGRMNL